jgi:1,2-phenylacetyl-CoA epoxidase catalytic subunit
MPTAIDAKPEPIYTPLQFELDDAPDDVKQHALTLTLFTGEVFTIPGIIDSVLATRARAEALAPTPADFVRINELFTDELRHFYMYDGLARELGFDPSTIDLASYEGFSEAHFKEVENWADMSAYNMLIDRFAGMLLADSNDASFAPLARINRTIATDEAGHAQTGYHHIRSLCETSQGKEEAQVAINCRWAGALAMRKLLPVEVETDMIRLGLRKKYGFELMDEFIATTTPLIENLGLKVPS